MFLLITKDNSNNDYKERVFDLKAKTKNEALKEAQGIILDYRFGEDREIEGPEDEPNRLFKREDNFYIVKAKLIEVSDAKEIDVITVCLKWVEEWNNK